MRHLLPIWLAFVLPATATAVPQEKAKDARPLRVLSKMVNDKLREASSARGAKLVYVDAEEFPGSVQLSGRYKIEGDKATVNVSLFVGDKELAAFMIECVASKPDELAAKIVAEVEKRLATNGGK